MSEPVQKGDIDLGSLNQALNEGEAASNVPASTLQSQSHTLTQPAVAATKTNIGNTGDAGSRSPATLSPSSARSLSPIPTSNSVSHTAHPGTAPAVDELKGMFPNLDTETIAAVLSSRGGDKEAAVNSLLQMSDPNFKPSNYDHQTDSDALLAHSIAMEEEQRQHGNLARQQPRHVSGRGGGGAASFFDGLLGSGTSNSSTDSSSRPASTYDPNNLTYQPRVRKPMPSPGARAAYHAPPAHSIDNDQSLIPGMPGPKEAKQWQDEINKMAETGLARASSAFSSLRQRANAAFNAPTNRVEEGGSAGASSADGNGSLNASQSFQGFQQTSAPSAPSMRRFASPRSPNVSEYDRDPAPVSDNDLAKIISRGSNSGSSTGGSGSNFNGSAGSGNRAKALADRYGLGIIKKSSSSTSAPRSGASSTSADTSSAFSGWEDAGRTPISITDNTANKSSGPMPTAAKDSIALMDGAQGRGLMSPRSEGADKAGSSTTGARPVSVSTSQTQRTDKHDDGNDSDDLEYVSNPFEDED
ncbi:hypothetical protein BCV70DRAFT_201576 [Testicularia cyperi]|uniref:CUE domain-containing protein n=1 Tax=Testicularia cyperi TaxID=1882483 RepID=A0A317XN33_9BASI|nr:hypothetical protein BCV70DRAFT_201576 [Testicularia cyperi]